MSTLAGNGSGSAPAGNAASGSGSGLWGPTGLALDGAGGVLVCEFYGHRVRGVRGGSGASVTLAGSPAGTPGFADATGTAARLRGPLAIAIAPARSPLAYFVENGNCVVRTLDTGSLAVALLAGSPGACASSIDGSGTSAGFGEREALYESMMFEKGGPRFAHSAAAHYTACAPAACTYTSITKRTTNELALEAVSI